MVPHRSLVRLVGPRVRAVLSSDRASNAVAVGVAVYGDCAVPLLYLSRGELATGDAALGGRLPILALLLLNGLVAQLLWWRLCRPLLVFALTGTYSVAVTVLAGDDVAYAALVVALYTVASRCSRRAAVVCCSLMAIYELSYGFSEGLRYGEPFELGMLNAVVLPAAATLLGRLTQALRTRGIELRSRQVQREVIVRTERQRLARELHDTVAHSLSGILMLAAGTRIGRGADHQEALRSIESASAQALRELGRMLGVLRATEGSDIDVEVGQATLADLDVLINQTRSCGVQVDLTVTGEPGVLDPSVDHAAFRTVQECLANVIKHGGNGAHARIDLSWTISSVTIEVHNTIGHHELTIPSGFGLRGIQERVDLVGGDFVADRLDTAHFRVRVVLPHSNP